MKKVTVKQKKEFIIKELGEVINGPALNFIATQIRLAGRRRGVKYDATVKTFALSIYHQSPKTYKMLRSVFSLPSIRTLKTDMQALNITVGFNNSVIKALKEKVSMMSEKDKIVAVIFDNERECVIQH